MATDYYIRGADSDQAQGPYQVEQLIALVEAGKVTKETLFYHPKLEAWLACGDDVDLAAQLFPGKKKLSLKVAQREPDSAPVTGVALPEPQVVVPKVRVADLLAAAEAESHDTRHLKEEQSLQELAASKVPMVLSTLLLAACVGYGAELLQHEGNIYTNPFLYLVLFDLILALLAALSVTEIFPLIRIRAGAVFGFLGYLAYADWILGVPMAGLQILCLAVFSIALFVVSFTLHYRWMIAHWIMGISAILFYGYLRYSTH